MIAPDRVPATTGNGSPETASAPVPPLVEFRRVTKRFGDGAGEKVAIQDVTFRVDDLPGDGEMISIVGPSGCGKSTILRLIGGLRPHFPATTGEALLHGRPIAGPGADRGMVDQKYSLLPHLTVLDNVAFGLKLRGVARSERRDRAEAWLKKVGLAAASAKYPSELSGGMQQRVAIAATLILNPRILLMDEPFGALDPKIRLQMQALLVELWREQETTVFLVTHSVEEAIYLGDRVLRLAAHPGRLIEVLSVPRPDEPPEVMRRRPWFREAEQELLRRLEDDLPAGAPLPGP